MYKNLTQVFQFFNIFQNSARGKVTIPSNGRPTTFSPQKHERKSIGNRKTNKENDATTEDFFSHYDNTDNTEKKISTSIRSTSVRELEPKLKPKLEPNLKPELETKLDEDILTTTLLPAGTAELMKH